MDKKIFNKIFLKKKFLASIYIDDYTRKNFDTYEIEIKK
tara:strand:- start:239 stop:355 length:117 start_codon:yes stop_codon:yes gene_type:complete